MEGAGQLRGDSPQAEEGAGQFRGDSPQGVEGAGLGTLASPLELRTSLAAPREELGEERDFIAFVSEQ